MLCAIELNAPWIVGGLVIWAVTQIVSGVIGAYVALKLQQKDMAITTKAVAELTKAVRQNTADISEARRERAGCELRATGRYATRDELVRAVTDQTAVMRGVEDKMDSLGSSMRESVGKVHGRVDRVAEDVAMLKGSLARDGAD